jgi:hypothetical protein
MDDCNSIEFRQKLALVWAERRERVIAVRVFYNVVVDRGCTVYSLSRIDEVGPLLPAA